MTIDPKTVSFTRKVFPQNIVFVDGMARAGKALLAPIVTSLDKTEPLEMRWMLEHVPVMNALGHISDNAAVTLMRTEVDLLYYNSLIGRNTNCRAGDATSIHKSRTPEEHIKRLTADEGEKAFSGLTPQSHIFVFFMHDACCHAGLYFETFPELKIILLKRHPVDLVHSWYRKRTAGLNHRSATPYIETSTEPVPWGAHSWEKTYLTLEPMDRVITLIYTLRQKRKEALDRLSAPLKKKILVVTYEDVLSRTSEMIPRISDFLETRPTDFTPALLERQRCPRPIDLEGRERKLGEIRGTASKQSLEIMDGMIEEYSREIN